jgi:hypothetical protein
MQQLFNIYSGPLFFAWIIPFAALLLILITFLSSFLWRLEKRYRNLLIASGLLFVLGAMGIEMIAGSYWESVDFAYTFTYRVLNALEEGLENTGSILALSSTIGYILRIRS